MTEKKPKAQSKTAIELRDEALNVQPDKQTKEHTPPKKRKAPSTAWVKGQSGNPAGRPKKGNAWTDIINEMMESSGLAITYTTTDESGNNIEHNYSVDTGNKRNVRQALATRMLVDALAGDVSTRKMLIEHEVGRALQTSLNASFDPSDLPELKEGENPIEYLLARFASKG